MWQQTVMSPEQLEAIIQERFPIFELNEEDEEERKATIEAIAKAQAEISYKAGYKKASDESNAISHLDCYEDGKKAGMKKVVEWMEKYKKIKLPKYQLQEWEIET